MKHERHGGTRGRRWSHTYRAYQHMMRRCYDRKDIGYKNYGGRGITVCRRWRSSFAAFDADVGPPPSPGHTLDRKNNTRGYTPKNVRWALRLEQNRNTRQNLYIRFRGQRLCLAAWVERIGLPYHTVKKRLHHGWPVNRALTAPVRPQQRRKEVS